jgi:DNA polymerase III sliding clamp (beta) subunit (PCNA family)
MQIEIQNKQLQNALKSVKKVFDKGVVVDPRHVQDCVIEGQEDGTVVLAAASNGLSIDARVLADVTGAGKVVVHRDYLGVKFPESSVSLRFDGDTNRMAFSSGAMRGDIAVSSNVRDVETRRPLKQPELTIELPREVLLAGCRHICFTPSATEPLNLRVLVEPDALVMTANDRYRGAAVRIPLAEHKGAGEIHIPAQLLVNVLAAMDDKTVRLGFDDRSVRIKGGGLDVCHPVLQFQEVPLKDVWDVVAKMEDDQTRVWAKFDAPTAKNALEAVASIPFAKDEGEFCVTLTPDDKGRFNVAMASSLSRAACDFEVAEIEMNDAEPMTFNQKYLSEFFAMIGDHTVEVTATSKFLIVRVEETMVWITPMTAK